MRGFRFRSSLNPLVSSACGRRNEAPLRTREKTSGTQGNPKFDRKRKLTVFTSSMLSSYVDRRLEPKELYTTCTWKTLDYILFHFY